MDLVVSENVKISGRADWVLGYGDSASPGEVSEFFVAIEAKKPGLVSTAVPQVLAYMGKNSAM